MTTAIATVGSPARLKELIAGQQQSLADVATRYLTPERVAKLALVAASRQPKLLECTPASLLRSLIDATSLGLDPSGLNAKGYLVPYKNGKLSQRARKDVFEAQFIPGYRGLVEIALRSGKVRYVDAHVAREGDAFSYRLGDNPGVEHVPALQDGGEVVAAYAVAYVEGIDKPIVEVMSRDQVEAIRKRSRASDSGPWVTDWEEMARKTVLRRICKRLPASDEMERALAVEVQAEQEVAEVTTGRRLTAAMVLGDEEPEELEPGEVEAVELLSDRDKASIRAYAAKVGLREEKDVEAAVKAIAKTTLDDCPAEFHDAILAELKAMSEVL